MADTESADDEAQAEFDRETVRMAKSDNVDDRQAAIERLLTASRLESIEKQICTRLLSAGLLSGAELDDQDRRSSNQDFFELWQQVLTALYTVDRISGAVEKFDPDLGSLSRWLETRVNLVISSWITRRRKKAQHGEHEERAEEPAAGDRLDERCDAFEESLNELNARERSALTLRIVPLRELVPPDQTAIRSDASEYGLPEVECDQRVAEVVTEFRWDENATRRYAKLMTKLSKASLGVRKAEDEIEYCGGLLKQFGHSKLRLQELTEQAERKTVEAIEKGYADEKFHTLVNGKARVTNQPVYWQKEYQVWCRKRFQRQQTLQNAQAELQSFQGIVVPGTKSREDDEAGHGEESSELVLTLVPYPRIGYCLNKSKGKVNDAMSDARNRLKQHGFQIPSSRADADDGPD